jgi:hypothetical protein
LPEIDRAALLMRAAGWYGLRRNFTGARNLSFFGKSQDLPAHTHSGDGSVIMKFTAMRVVCQNTLMLAMEDGQKAYRVRHSKQMQFKLDELAGFLAITQEVFLRAEELFKRLAKVQMNEHRLEHYPQLSTGRVVACGLISSPARHCTVG